MQEILDAEDVHEDEDAGGRERQPRRANPKIIPNIDLTYAE
ncbi:MAG: hypothetical protein ACREJC_19605 [Tepidisphaeraceae bacterium]